MKLLTKLNLVLIVVFAAGGVLISELSDRFLVNNARREVLAQAELMMAAAKSVRDYTSGDLSPLLQQNPRHKLRFIAESVPAFGATTIFNNLKSNYPEYSYKEATLNPTNLEHRAADWEADVIQEMRQHPELSVFTGERDTPTGRSLYLAKPIKVEQACLECHSVPSAAPAAMVAAYGSANGFGWKPGETISVQIVSVPMSVPVGRAKQAYSRLLIVLVVTSVVAILALDAAVYLLVIRRLKVVAETADRASRGEQNLPKLTVKGRDEVATVTAAFNRLQVSLAKALNLLGDQ